MKTINFKMNDMNNYQQSALHNQVQQLLAVNLLTETDFSQNQIDFNLLDQKFIEKHSLSSSHVKRAQSQGFNPEQTPECNKDDLNEIRRRFDNFQNNLALMDYAKDQQSDEGGDGGIGESSSSEGDEEDILDDAGDDEYQLLIQGAGQETIEVLREIEREQNDQRMMKSFNRTTQAGGLGTSSMQEENFFCHITQQEQLLLLSSDPKRAKDGYNQNSKTINEVESEDKPKSRMNILIPPPNPLLPKMMLPDEPTKNGFLKKFIDLGKRPRIFEKERAPCGPHKTTSGRGISSLKQQAPLSQSVMAQPLQTIPEFPVSTPTQNIQAPTITLPAANSINAPLQTDNNQQIVQSNLDDLSNPGNETSLRHFFYMEYRKMQPNEKNQIVYSRFGKQNYDSEDKFCPDSFSQLIRTCNIKRLLKGLPGDMNLSMTQIQQQMQSQLNQYHRFREESREPRSFPQESAPNRSYYIPRTLQDTTLVFESRFECGNLQLAHKLSDKEYNLILQNDLNSKGHTQWFYFRISNTRKGSRIKFNMLNFLKSKSLFNEGMKILAFSEKKLENEGIGWNRSGEEISYFQNNYRREAMTNYQRCYHTFTFTYKFEYDHDTVFFAYSQPYSYSDLMDDITDIEKMKLDYVSRNILCRTLAGNRCDYLTITSRSAPNTNDIQVERQIKKKGVVISARVHPGESNSSWMMKGVIDFLISDCKEAQELRDNFVFKIIPMLNPDGVINGNYRCSLAGCDLNRRWKYPSPVLHPTIFSTKQLIKQFSSERPLVLYCDLHGHSRRKNVFMYGNHDQKNPEAFRIFPYLMSKISGPLFSYDYSRFKVQKNKEQTARIALWKELKNPNIFTLEASFCGPKYTGIPQTQKSDENEDMNYHYTTNDLMDIGKKLCQTIILYNSSNIDTDKQIEELKSYHQKKALVESTPNAQSIPASAHKSLERNSNVQSSAKSESRKTTFQRRNTAILEMNTGLTQTLADGRDSTDSEASVSLPIVFGNLSIKEIVKELKQKIQDEKAQRRVAIVERDDENNSSEEDSDSGESEDNLDAEQLVQIMPKKIIKKNQQTTNSVKRRKGKNGVGPNTKKIMKEDGDQGKKDQDKNSSQRRQSIRSLRDFKKPTQSFLQKFGLVGPTNKVKFGQASIHKREFCTQTIDYDDLSEDEELQECELSAMERDIMLCTGFIPDKLKKLAKAPKFEGHHSHMFINLVRLEASRLKGVNTPLLFRRENGSIIIGKNTPFSIAGLVQSPINPHRHSSSQICSGDETEASHRIRIDLSKIQDRPKDAKKMSSNVLGENNGLKNVQVIYSKNDGERGALSAKNTYNFSQKMPDVTSKENNDSKLAIVTGQLNIAKANSTHSSNMRDKSAPTTGPNQNENYDITSTQITSNYGGKKNFRVIDLNNLRQDSTQSLKVAGGLASQNLNEGIKGKSGGNIFDSRKRHEQQENLIDKEFFNQNEYKNEPQILPRSQVQIPFEMNQHNAALANRSLSYHRKVSQPINSGNIKARLTLQGNQKSPQIQMGSTINNFSQPSQAPSNTQLQNPIPGTQFGISHESSLKNIWDSMAKVPQTRIILNQQTSSVASQQLAQVASSSPHVQMNNQSSKLQNFMKAGGENASSAIGQTILEKIDEKQTINNNLQARSSSQGNYSGTATSKFHSMKAKLTPALNNGKQLKNVGGDQQHTAASMSNRNTATTISSLNSQVPAALLTAVNNGTLKKQLQDKQQPSKQAAGAGIRERQTMSANQSQYVMGMLNFSTGQQSSQPVTRM